MNRLAKIQYLKQIVEELEEELAKDVNTKKDEDKSIDLQVAANATANDIEEFSPYVCEAGNKGVCLLIKGIIIIATIAIICIAISYA